MTFSRSQGFLTEAQRKSLLQFPEDIPKAQLIQHFTLTEADFNIIPKRSPAYSKVGFVLSLCALRFLGFIPELFDPLPDYVLQFLLKQLSMEEIRGFARNSKSKLES